MGAIHRSICIDTLHLQRLLFLHGLFCLFSTKLIPHTKKTVIGSLQTLETILFTEILNNLDISEYQDAPVIIKGCAGKPIPGAAYGMLISKLQPIAKKYYVRRGLLFCAPF